MPSPMLDKGRPELGPAEQQVRLGAFRMPTPKAMDVTRQSIETQMTQLSANIRFNLKLIGRLAAQGRFEKAGTLADIVSRNRARLHELAIERQAKLDLGPIQEQPKASRGRTRQKVKTKRYKTWSDQ